MFVYLSKDFHCETLDIVLLKQKLCMSSWQQIPVKILIYIYFQIRWSHVGIV